jgi:dolichol-phosphate mannosyltransferase
MGMEAHVSRTLIIIPTYNEVANLEPLVVALRAHAADADILVVDDASPDGTGEVADRLAQDPAVHVLHRPGKDGLGRWTPTARIGHQSCAVCGTRPTPPTW